MRTLLTTFLVLFIGVLALAAQSRPGTQTGDGKVNKRTAEPAATPPENARPGTSNKADDDDVIKINTALVSIPVRVMDKKGRFIGGLRQPNFKVFEDGVEQEVGLFSNEHEPFTVALMLDMSYSSTFKIADIQNAAISFIDQLRPQDRVMVISFDEDVHVLCEATGDRQQIYRAIKSTRIATGTSIYDAVDVVINERLRRIEGRKAIILFTDGVDTTSRRATDVANRSDAMELDSLVYPIRYDTFADVQRMKNKTGLPMPAPTPVPTTGSDKKIPFPISILGSGGAGSRGTTAEEYRFAEEYLEDLANKTGGRMYLASSLGNLAEAFSRIASELREFYSLGYYPSNDRVQGRTANIKIRVDQPGLVVRAREGYIVRRKSKTSSR